MNKLYNLFITNFRLIKYDDPLYLLNDYNKRDIETEDIILYDLVTNYRTLSEIYQDTFLNNINDKYLFIYNNYIYYEPLINIYQIVLNKDVILYKLKDMYKSTYIFNIIRKKLNNEFFLDNEININNNYINRLNIYILDTSITLPKEYNIKRYLHILNLLYNSSLRDKRKIKEYKNKIVILNATYNNKTNILKNNY
tara:strand:+ start:1189 stop:1776 length:588 start_codon:yes stop_codon:yes gene_type:complete